MIEGEQARLDAANQFIKVIASCGRNFFSENSDSRNKKDDPFISFMEVDKNGKVWFTDNYTRKKIYTHYKGHWMNSSNGGTLEAIIRLLREHIKRGKTMRIGYFTSNEKLYCSGHPWGYDEDLEIVKQAAIDLGIAD